MIGVIEFWPDFFNIGRDWSLGEIFNYLKWAALIFLLFRAWLREKDLLLLMMCIFFMIVFADDMLMVHERVGAFLIINSGLHLKFDAFQLGEIAIWAVMGGCGLILIYTGWRKADQNLRARTMPMGWLFCGVLFCAVVIDTLHSLIPERTLLGGIFLILEDGGEMLFISALLSYAVGAFWAARHQNFAVESESRKRR